MGKKLIVTGYGRHGKDTFCGFLEREAGYKFTTSSFVAAEFVFREIGERYGYKNPLECWEDRFNHRGEWYRIITNYNTPDKAKLAKEIFKNFDIYCGIRNKDEFNSAKEEGLFDLSIWVDASERLPPEENESITISKEDCDIVIDNNKSLEELELETKAFCERFLT